MKKSYLMIAAASVLTFAACSNNDYVKEIVDENETVLIGFETFHEKATKAAVNAAADLTTGNGGFGVFGYNHTDNRAVSSGAIDMTTTGTTKVFNNVKVWYDDGADTKDFTYEVPKYWDKYKYYTFFAYAPYSSASGVVTLTESTGKFTRTDIASLQSTNSTTTAGTNNRTKYDESDETGVVDYLIAVCVPGQKYAATNQSGYTGYEKTVGFTFNHILSKLNVNVQAKDETSGHEYLGVSNIQVTKLNITNLPNTSSNVTYTQTAANSADGTYTPATYATTLNIISGDNATAAGPLYILDGGANASGSDPITAPADYINQNFHYFIAPNAPSGTNKYTLNIEYTINYVDGISDSFTRSVDLSAESAAFTSMARNNIYNINVTIGLDQIYFAVDNVIGWATPVDTDVAIN